MLGKLPHYQTLLIEIFNLFHQLSLKFQKKENISTKYSSNTSIKIIPIKLLHIKNQCPIKLVATSALSRLLNISQKKYQRKNLSALTQKTSFIREELTKYQIAFSNTTEKVILKCSFLKKRKCRDKKNPNGTKLKQNALRKLREVKR